MHGQTASLDYLGRPLSSWRLALSPLLAISVIAWTTTTYSVSRQAENNRHIACTSKNPTASVRTGALDTAYPLGWLANVFVVEFDGGCDTARVFINCKGEVSDSLRPKVARTPDGFRVVPASTICHIG